MMRGMSHAASHHPRSRSSHVEKRCLSFPPSFILTPQHGQTFSAVFFVAPHEFQPDLLFRKRWCPDVYIKHCPEPGILAHTLVHHVLMKIPPALVRTIGPNRKIIVREHAPRTNHLNALCLIGLDQKVVFHCDLPSCRLMQFT